MGMVKPVLSLPPPLNGYGSVCMVAGAPLAPVVVVCGCHGMCLWLHSIALQLHCIALQRSALHCSALIDCIALHRLALHGIAYCIAGAQGPIRVRVVAG